MIMPLGVVTRGARQEASQEVKRTHCRVGVSTAHEQQSQSAGRQPRGPLSTALELKMVFTIQRVIKTRNSPCLAKPTAFSTVPLQKKLASPNKLSPLPAPLVRLRKKPAL